MKEMKLPNSNLRNIEVQNSVESIVSMIQSLSIEYEIREKIYRRQISELLLQNQFLYIAKKTSMEALLSTDDLLRNSKISKPENLADATPNAALSNAPLEPSDKKPEPIVPEFVKIYRSIIKNINSFTENFNIDLTKGTPASLLINIREHLKLTKFKVSEQQKIVKKKEDDKSFNDSLRAQPIKTVTSKSKTENEITEIDDLLTSSEDRSIISQSLDKRIPVEQSNLADDSINDKEYEEFVKNANSNPQMQALINPNRVFDADPSAFRISKKIGKKIGIQSDKVDSEGARNRSTTLYQVETPIIDLPPKKKRTSELFEPVKEPFSYTHDISNFLILSKTKAFRTKGIDEIYFGEIDQYTTSEESLTKETNGKLIMMDDLQDIFEFFSTCNMCIAATTSKVYIVTPPNDDDTIYDSEDKHFVHCVYDLKSPIIDATGHIFAEGDLDDDLGHDLVTDVEDEESKESNPDVKDCIVLLHRNYMCTFLNFKFKSSVKEVSSFSTTCDRQNPFKVLMHPSALEGDEDIYKAIFIYPGFVRNINCETSDEDVPFRTTISSYLKDKSACIKCACMTSYKFILGFDSGHAFIFDLFAKIKFLFDVNFESPIRDILVDPFHKTICADQSTGMFACPFDGTGEKSVRIPIEIAKFTQVGGPFIPLRYDSKNSIYIFLNSIDKSFYSFKLNEKQ